MDYMFIVKLESKNILMFTDVYNIVWYVFKHTIKEQ